MLLIKVYRHSTRTWENWSINWDYFTLIIVQFFLRNSWLEKELIINNNDNNWFYTKKWHVICYYVWHAIWVNPRIKRENYEIILKKIERHTQFFMCQRLKSSQEACQQNSLFENLKHKSGYFLHIFLINHYSMLKRIIMSHIFGLWDRYRRVHMLLRSWSCKMLKVV